MSDVIGILAVIVLFMNMVFLIIAVISYKKYFSDDDETKQLDMDEVRKEMLDHDLVADDLGIDREWDLNGEEK